MNPKILLAGASLMIGLSAFGQQQNINLGTTANDGTGDQLRTAFTKINANTSNLFQIQTNIAKGTNVVAVPTNNASVPLDVRGLPAQSTNLVTYSTNNDSASVVSGVSAIGNFRSPSGSAMQTAYGQHNNPSNGMWFPNGSNSVAISVAGTNTIFATNNGTSGLVGINKTNPATALDVNGIVTATSFVGNVAGNASSASSAPGGNITGSHTLPDGVLSTNVPLQNNPTNFFTGGANGGSTNIFSNISFRTNWSDGIMMYHEQILGFSTNPATAAQGSFQFNAGHGGNGDGSEMQETWNQKSVNILPGGWEQFGRRAGGAITTFYVAGNGSASLGVGVTSHLFGYQFSWFNSGTIFGDFMLTQVVPIGTNGACNLIYYDPTWANSGNPNNANSDFPSTQPTVPRLEVVSGVGIAPHGNILLDRSFTEPPVAGTYNINLGTAVQDVYATTSLTLAITNLGIAANTNSVPTVVNIYSGTTSVALTISPAASINVIWQNEAGTATAPSSVAASNVLTLNMRADISGGVTNVFITPRPTVYTPKVDTDAQTFFASVAGLSLIESNAVNNLVVEAKNAGLWSGVDFLYPFVGSTSAKCAWNLKNPTLYKVTWTVTNSTFTTGGWTSFAVPSDSSQTIGEHGDTAFNPSTATTPNYTQNSATYMVYCGTASPSGGTIAPWFFMGAVSSVRSGLGETSAAGTLGKDGLNNGNGVSGSVTSATFNGLLTVTLFGGTLAVYDGAGNTVSGAASTTGVPNANVWIGGKNNGGLQSPITARFGLVMGGAGLTPTQVAQWRIIASHFVTALGRQ